MGRIRLMNFHKTHPSDPPVLSGPFRLLPWVAIGLFAAGIIREVTTRQKPDAGISTAALPLPVPIVQTEEDPPPNDLPVSTPALLLTGASEMDTFQQMTEQVRRMREYAGMAAPNDPFALTEEQIKEFQQQGSPIIW